MRPARNIRPQIARPCACRARRGRAEAGALCGDPGDAARSWIFRNPRRKLHERRRPAASLAGRAIAEIYPLSVHGVGLSLGSAEALDRERLARLARVVALYQPALVSEHLAWSDFSGRAFPDLLPLPYDEANCRRIADKIDATQTALGRAILIENPATYLRFEGDVARRDAISGRTRATIRLRPAARRQQCPCQRRQPRFCGAGLSRRLSAGAGRAKSISPASPEATRRPRRLPDRRPRRGGQRRGLGALRPRAAPRRFPRPTLVEWDNDVPDWEVLHGEARKALAAFSATSASCRAQRLPHSTSKRGEWPTSSNRGLAPGAGQFAEALADPARPVPGLFTPCDTSARFSVYRNNSAVASDQRPEGAVSDSRETRRRRGFFRPRPRLCAGDPAALACAGRLWRRFPRFRRKIPRFLRRRR